MKVINFEPEAAWRYHNINRDLLKNNSLLIAKNEEYGVEIYMGTDEIYPQFMVFVDGDCQFNDFAISLEDCIVTLNEIFDDYLTEKFIQDVVSEQIDESCEHPTNTEVDEEDIVEIIKSREGALVASMLEFILEATDNDDQVSEPDFWDRLQDCLEHTLKYLSEKNFDIYRPMLIKDEETKKVSLIEFPYKEYDFS